MSDTTDRTGLEVLSEDECRELLARPPVRVGRLAFVVDGQPKVMPVNYIWHEDTVVFQTNSGSKLDAAYQTELVAFEIDAVDAQWRDGWSVVVEGRVAAVEDPDEANALAELPLRPWAEKQRRIYVRIHPSRITGRRL